MEQDFTQNPEEPKQEDVISNYMNEMAQADIEFHQSVVKKARNALFLAAVLVFIGEMVGMFKDGGAFNVIVLVVALIETGLFVGFAVWTKWKPYSAVIGGLIAFISIILIATIFNGLTGGIGAALLALVGGAIFKVFVLAALINALKNAKTLQSIQKKGA